MTKRHRWGDKIAVTPHKTEQACRDCPIVKVSRNEHEGGRPVYWIEFYCGLDRIEGNATPACEPVEVPA